MGCDGIIGVDRMEAIEVLDWSESHPHPTRRQRPSPRGPLQTPAIPVLLVTVVHLPTSSKAFDAIRPALPTSVVRSALLVPCHASQSRPAAPTVGAAPQRLLHGASTLAREMYLTILPWRRTGRSRLVQILPPWSLPYNAPSMLTGCCRRQSACVVQQIFI